MKRRGVVGNILQQEGVSDDIALTYYLHTTAGHNLDKERGAYESNTNNTGRWGLVATDGSYPTGRSTTSCGDMIQSVAFCWGTWALSMSSGGLGNICKSICAVELANRTRLEHSSCRGSRCVQSGLESAE